MSSAIESLKIDLHSLATATKEDYEKEFWDNYETYLEEYNTILADLQNMGLFQDEQSIAKVPDEQKAYLGVGFSGPEQAKLRQIVNSSSKLFAKLNKISEQPSEKGEKKPMSKNIFVVHGHDEEMKQCVARKIEKLGLKAIILHEQPNKGCTIIEKFADYSDVSFAVVLVSPDDKGCKKNENIENIKFRARQNVIFELGYFLGKIGRKNVAVIFRNVPNFEIPTDYDGVVWIPYSDKWEFDLVKELNACGYQVDANKLL